MKNKEILNEIFRNLELQQLPNLKSLRKKKIHLAVFTEPYLTFLLDGKKTIESRFSKKKVTPYENIEKDDIVFVKKSGGNVVAYFTIQDVFFFDLQKTSISFLKKKYQNELCVTNQFWHEKEKSNYATFLFVDKLFLFTPFSISKKGMQSWITFF